MLNSQTSSRDIGSRSNMDGYDEYLFYVFVCFHTQSIGLRDQFNVGSKNEKHNEIHNNVVNQVSAA